MDEKERSVKSKGSHEISDDGEESSVHSSYDEATLEEFKKFLQKNNKSGNLINETSEGRKDSVKESE